MELTQSLVEEWVATSATGKFHYTKILDGQIDPKKYAQVRVIMQRLHKQGKAYPVDSRDGWWRSADMSMDEIHWWDGADEGTGSCLLLPMGLHEYGYMSLPMVILVAGVYNQGKTAFCLNVVNLNLERWGENTHLFISEGVNQLNWKFTQMHPPVPIPPPFKVYRRFANFEDVIQPDGLNVIDYLRTDMDKPYAVSNTILAITQKLGPNGIAVIAMQKPMGRKIAFGGASTAWEPTFYISIDKGYLGFEKIKAPRMLDYDPYSLRINFAIHKGVNFEKLDEVIE